MNKQVFVHLCTWFQTKEVSNEWKMWNSDYFESPHNPDIIRYDKKRDIATTSYPLIGVYDSSDSFLIEYQFQLMVLAGIDGVIVDWDGRSINPERHLMFLKILPFLNKYKLKLIVCFEEWCGYYPKDTNLNRAEEVSKALAELEWLNTNVIEKSYYATLDGSSPVYVFRKVADSMFNSLEWNYIKNNLSNKNIEFYFNDCYTDELNNCSDGYFFWVGGFDKNNSNSLDFLKNELDCFRKKAYEKKRRNKVIMSVVPGFDDTPVWGWGETPRIAPRYNGKRYSLMWESIIRENDNTVQIVTFNDWNEGSQIEPSVENGFKYLNLTRKYISIFKNIEEKEYDFNLALTYYKERKEINFSLSSSNKEEELTKILRKEKRT